MRIVQYVEDMSDRLLKFAPLLGVLLMVGCATSAASHSELSTPARSLSHQSTHCLGSPSGDPTVHDTGSVDLRPEARLVPPLEYPASALHDRIQGVVDLGLIINEDGTVDQDSITVVRSLSPELDDQAVLAVSRATFYPACVGGKAVRMRAVVPVKFQITASITHP